jgi:galactokinase
VQGVTAALRQRGQTIRGFDVWITSSVPLGAGLSSSAALEVAVARALNEAFALGLDGVEIAMTAHRAETGLVGAPVGVMDQMASSLGGRDAAIFLDTRSLAFERLPLPSDTSLIVIDSGVSHRHAGGEYRTRRAECDQAARQLGVAALRDIGPDQLRGLALPAPLDRRVRHVVTENARVLSARDALRQGDAHLFGRLMNESHASLRDDFEVSVSQLDALVELAQSEPSVFGARMTGGGFGGSIVALARSRDSAAAAERIATRYGERVSERGSVLIS